MQYCNKEDSYNLTTNEYQDIKKSRTPMSNITIGIFDEIEESLTSQVK